MTVRILFGIHLILIVSLLLKTELNVWDGLLLILNTTMALVHARDIYQEHIGE